MATRDAMNLLFDRAWADAQAGCMDDYVSGNNDADGPFLLHWVRQHLPHWESALTERLTRWGGNASGQMVANIDNLGHVHPDTMWWHHDLGCVRDRPFSQIWNDTSDPLDGRAQATPPPGARALRRCQYLAICNGNTRVRAQQLTGNPWFEDPGCYLTDDEVGAVSTPFEVPAKTNASNSIRRSKRLKMHNILQKYPKIISERASFLASNVFAQTPPTAPTPPSINAAALYQQHCASCHGEQRTGLMGPALLPESLERTRAPKCCA